MGTIATDATKPAPPLRTVISVLAAVREITVPQFVSLVRLTNPALRPNQIRRHVANLVSQNAVSLSNDRMTASISELQRIANRRKIQVVLED